MLAQVLTAYLAFVSPVQANEPVTGYVFQGVHPRLSDKSKDAISDYIVMTYALYAARAQACGWSTLSEAVRAASTISENTDYLKSGILQHLREKVALEASRRGDSCYADEVYPFRQTFEKSLEGFDYGKEQIMRRHRGEIP